MIFRPISHLLSSDQLVDQVLREHRLPTSHTEKKKPAKHESKGGDLKPLKGSLDWQPFIIHFGWFPHWRGEERSFLLDHHLHSWALRLSTNLFSAPGNQACLLLNCTKLVGGQRLQFSQLALHHSVSDTHHSRLHFPMKTPSSCCIYHLHQYPIRQRTLGRRLGSQPDHYSGDDDHLREQDHQNNG